MSGTAQQQATRAHIRPSAPHPAWAQTAQQQAATEYIRPSGQRPAWAIFPVNERKSPITAHGFNDATRDPDQIMAWWMAHPSANIGIPTGEINGIVVIDVDKNHAPGVDGEDTLQGLEAGAMGKLPETVEVLTPNGGRHLYFKYPANAKKPIKSVTGPKMTRPIQGIDIRANGGYVVAPPSILAETGKSWEWELSSDPIDTPLAELPAPWVQWITFQQEWPWDKWPRKIEQGARNETLFSFTASMRAQSYPEDKMAKELRAYNALACKPPLDGSELTKILQSVLKYPAGTSLQQMGIKQQRPRMTVEALTDEIHKRGWDVRHNVISGEYETIGKTASGRTINPDDLVTLLHDGLGDTYRGATLDAIRQYVGYIAREHAYNPVIEYISAATWDGVDRLPEVYDLLGITGDQLSMALTRKWLLQCVALLYNDQDNPYGAAGCLVLNGPQGAGKTSFFRHLALRDVWFGEGLSIDDHDKDTTRRIITRWISELGEVESTLKSDVEKLKAFITSTTDRYRLPYGREDTVALRRTSMCATCNSDRYLIDPTGNRRWWSIPLTQTIPYAAIQELDALQVWAQINAMIYPMTRAQRSECYQLSQAEQQALATRNGDFTKFVKAQTEVEDILTQYRERKSSAPVSEMTVSEFKDTWAEYLRPYSAQQISAALRACGVEIKRTKTGAKLAISDWLASHGENDM